MSTGIYGTGEEWRCHEIIYKKKRRQEIKSFVYCKSGYFRENLFSRISLKDIFATLKIHDLGII